MSLPNGLTVVFNGEIYNYIELKGELEAKGHSFRTRSDTEVLLAAYETWGEGCLEKFNGMFAFVVYDPKKERLFFARDRMGESHSIIYLSTERSLKCLDVVVHGWSNSRTNTSTHSGKSNFGS